MAFKPIDPKRDEYRRYLERGGIIESLTKVFVRILKERPEDPTQYLLQNLGDARLQADNIAYLQSELDDARAEIQRLTDIIRNINPDLLNDTPIKNSTPNNVSIEENVDEIQQKNSGHQQMPEYNAAGTLEESVDHAQHVSPDTDVVQNINNCTENS
ncbi:c-Myc-binding protein homolog [Musca vetustissima]|uniref:c-Myc-binding protein homolog n=1 Tax=Musca vetustissima TaxID=27455 RepID=UPI002AB6A34E|nr:c-Myc-binding protein homolog [Musca vetustissima]